LATADDVKETGFLTTQHGVYVGGWYDETEHRLHSDSATRIHSSSEHLNSVLF
jgi:hypothetical protein